MTPEQQEGYRFPVDPRPPAAPGFQVSLDGLAGLLLAVDEGFERKVLGLNIGFDAAVPARKLPGIGRLGLER
jgi:hypothetical protein